MRRPTTTMLTAAERSQLLVAANHDLRNRLRRASAGHPRRGLCRDGSRRQGGCDPRVVGETVLGMASQTLCELARQPQRVAGLVPLDDRPRSQLCLLTVSGGVVHSFGFRSTGRRACGWMW